MKAMSSRESLESLASRLIPISDGARLLGMSKQTIYNQMSNGKLKRVKVGHKVFLDRRELEGLLRKALMD